MKFIEAEADLNPQIEEAIQKLAAEEKKISTIRSLLVATQSQLTRKEERIRELRKEIKNIQGLEGGMRCHYQRGTAKRK